MTMQTIAVIGAGPGVGRAVAERFGRGGYQVALLARDTTNLNGVADYLAERGVTARTYRADVLDRSDLAGTLATIGAEFGPIDVLEYSPVPPVGSMRRPRDIDADNELFHLDFAVLGAVAAVQAVLPGMIARRHGSLLFTTAPSAERPMQMTGSFGVAGGALLNYVRLLHDDLAADNVYVGAVSVAGIVTHDQLDEQHLANFPPGIPRVPAADVAELHWHLHTTHDRVLASAGNVDAFFRVPGMA